MNAAQQYFTVVSDILAQSWADKVVYSANHTAEPDQYTFRLNGDFRAPDGSKFEVLDVCVRATPFPDEVSTKVGALYYQTECA
jgi:hypothetical protein